MKIIIAFVIFFSQFGYATLSDEGQMARLEFRASAHQLALELNDEKITQVVSSAEAKLDHDLWSRFAGDKVLQSTVALKTLVTEELGEQAAISSANDYLKTHSLTTTWADIVNTDGFGPASIHRSEYAMINTCHASMDIKKISTGAVTLTGDPNSFETIAYYLTWRDGRDRFILQLNTSPKTEKSVVDVVGLVHIHRSVGEALYDHNSNSYQAFRVDFASNQIKQSSYTREQDEKLDPASENITYTDRKGTLVYRSHNTYLPKGIIKTSTVTGSSANIQYIPGYQLLESHWDCDEYPARWIDRVIADEFVRQRADKFSNFHHVTEAKRVNWLKCLSEKAASDCEAFEKVYASGASAREKLWNTLFRGMPAVASLKVSEAKDFVGNGARPEVLPAAYQSVKTDELKAGEAPKKVVDPDAARIEDNPPFAIPARSCTYVRRNGALSAFCDANLSCNFIEGKRPRADCSDGRTIKP